MKFGICIPTNMGIENFRALMSIGPKAEELGFDSVWVSEHLFNAGYIGERIGGRPYYEPLTVLTYLAAMISRIRLGTSVLVLPYHDPVRLAKVVATLDVASGGRVVLGLGVGRIEEEYDALGISFKERGAIANEAIEVMKILWTQEDPAFSGRYYSFSKVKFSPKPAQKPFPPLWIGGNSPSAMKRAARVGDAWHPTGLSPNGVRQGLEYVHRMAAQARRPSPQVTATLLVAWDPGDASSDKASGEGTALAGSFEHIIQRVKEYESAGVEAMAIKVASDDPFIIQRHIERFAAEVLPAFQ